MRETRETKASNKQVESLGARLRAAREARGLSVHKLAQDMHVSDDIIEALESNNFAHLGAPIFVRGHLRNYARLLGLPENEILAAEHAADKLAPPALITQTPGSHTFAKRFAMPVFSLLIAVLLVILGVVWWLHRPVVRPPATQVSNGAATSQNIVTQPPAATSIPLSAAHGTSVPGTENGAIKSVETRPPAPAAEAPVRKTGENAAVQQTAARAREPTTASHPAAVVPTTQLVYAQFDVSQPSWIEVYDASGKRLYYALSPAGDKFKVSGAGPLQVFLGNAPGVSIEMNGAPFNLAPYTRSDNTARFRLGPAAVNSSPTD